MMIFTLSSSWIIIHPKFINKIMTERNWNVLQYQMVKINIEIIVEIIISILYVGLENYLIFYYITFGGDSKIFIGQIQFYNVSKIRDFIVNYRTHWK